MKKIILSLAFILLTGIIFGQTFRKGDVLGIHIANYNLQPGVTIEQAEDFLVNEYCQAFNNAFDGMSAIPLKGLRGEDAGKIAVIFYLESDDVRNKYWAEEGVLTEAGEAAWAEIQPMLEEYSELMIQVSDPYTDWEIQ